MVPAPVIPEYFDILASVVCVMGEQGSVLTSRIGGARFSSQGLTGPEAGIRNPEHLVPAVMKEVARAEVCVPSSSLLDLWIGD